MPKNFLSGGRYTVGKRFGTGLQNVIIITLESSFCQQKTASGCHILFTIPANYAYSTQKQVLVLHKHTSDIAQFHIFMPENACPPREQRLYRSGRLLVRLANNACTARPDCLCCSSKPIAATKNSAFRTNSGRFFSISIVNISLPV